MMWVKKEKEIIVFLYYQVWMGKNFDLVRWGWAAGSGRVGKEVAGGGWTGGGGEEVEVVVWCLWTWILRVENEVELSGFH